MENEPDMAAVILAANRILAIYGSVTIGPDCLVLAPDVPEWVADHLRRFDDLSDDERANLREYTNKRLSRIVGENHG